MTRLLDKKVHTGKKFISNNVIAKSVGKNHYKMSDLNDLNDCIITGDASRVSAARLSNDGQLFINDLIEAFIDNWYESDSAGKFKVIKVCCDV